MAERGRRSCIGNRRRRWRAWARAGGHRTAFPGRGLSCVHGRRRARRKPRPDLREALARKPPPRHGRGRTLVGPHRADLSRRLHREGGAGARMLHRGAEGAADLAHPRQCPGAGAGYGAPPILLLDEVAAHLDAPPRRALRRDLRARGAGLDDRHRPRAVRRSGRSRAALSRSPRRTAPRRRARRSTAAQSGPGFRRPEPENGLETPNLVSSA